MRNLLKSLWCAAALVCTLSITTVLAQQEVEEQGWLSLFNGRNLDGWVPKIRTHAFGVNHLNTFRVVDGLLTVSYDGYSDFNNQFGHLIYNTPFSHYRLHLEYRFIGERGPNVQDWAHRNSGVMLHGQAPDTMPLEQDFPISLEAQFLGGLSDGKARPTGNLCTPGTHVVYQGRFTDTHCINSTSPTFDGDQWVAVDILVLGNERIVQSINGEVVIEYGGTVTGGGVVAGHRPEMKPEGAALERGFISLQSEGHPIQFRNIMLQNLVGCMDQAALNFKPWFMEASPDSCRYP